MFSHSYQRRRFHAYWTGHDEDTVLYLSLRCFDTLSVLVSPLLGMYTLCPTVANAAGRETACLP